MFSTVSFLLLLINATLFASTQVKIKTKWETVEGELVSMTPDGSPIIKHKAGPQVKIPKQDILAVEMPAPPSFQSARESFVQGQFKKVLELLGDSMESYAGLPVPWVAEALFMAAESHLQLNQGKAAAEILQKMERHYRDTPFQDRATLAKARLAMEEKRNGDARDLLKPILDKADAALDLPPEQAPICAGALWLSGQLFEKEGKLNEALESYLRVTSFFSEPASVVEQSKIAAEQLKKKGTAFVP